jgi:hypothetical protein
MATRKSRRQAGEDDLLTALDRTGCPVCRLVAEAVDGFLESVCYEGVNDLELREELRQAGGFCGEHASRFLGQSHGQLATAIVYRDVLLNAARRLAPAPRGSGIGELLGRAPRRRAVAGDRRRCPACRIQTEATERHLQTLRARLVDVEVQARYRSGGGLCLPHLDRALELDDEGVRFLAEAAAADLGTLIDELARYIRKHDYRFRGEPWEGEEDAPRRAIERAVGGAGPTTIPATG